MGRKSGRQVAALPMRLTEAGAAQVLLVTSRETRRWIIPKGWPMKRLKDHRAAAMEAEEEAGISGPVLNDAIGQYTYWRRAKRDFRLTSVVVFLMRIEGRLGVWKEKSQRDVRWIDAQDAAGIVQEPELITLIETVLARPGTRAFLSRLEPKSPTAP